MTYYANQNMKKIVTVLCVTAAVLLTARNSSAQTPYIGGSLTAAYHEIFRLDTHFFGGYEFNDKWAIGGGLGLDIAAYDEDAAIGAFLGANVRFTPWHNNFLFTDIKFRTETIINEGIETADVGLCGSLRFRVSDHFDIFTDFVCLGARYENDDFSPLIGILGNGCTLGVHYRF